MISIKGIYNVDGSPDTVELLTCGRFYRRNNSYWLSYDESETTGFEGHKTTLRIEDGKVTMRRSGVSESQLVIQQGIRHQCLYDTGFGSITVGVNGRAVKSTLDDNGGTVDFSYSMDINTALTSENRVIIEVKPSSDNIDA
jgi:uncharacterized beta-barrel protein YwiB (DUF1934 family)